MKTWLLARIEDKPAAAADTNRTMPARDPAKSLPAWLTEGNADGNMPRVKPPLAPYPSDEMTTSPVGARDGNQRMSYSPLPPTIKAVSDRFISPAIANNSASWGHAASRQAAAGLPEKARSAKESTTKYGRPDCKLINARSFSPYRGTEPTLVLLPAPMMAAILSDVRLATARSGSSFKWA